MADSDLSSSEEQMQSSDEISQNSNDSGNEDDGSDEEVTGENVEKGSNDEEEEEDSDTGNEGSKHVPLVLLKKPEKNSNKKKGRSVQGQNDVNKVETKAKPKSNIKSDKSSNDNKNNVSDAPLTKHKYDKDIVKKYSELKGKQLFVRFPKVLPRTVDETEKYVKKLYDKIIKVHRPRQKSTRFCLVEFDNEKDRAKALKELAQVEVDGKKLIVMLPKTENEEYINKLVEYQAKKLQKIHEKKRAKKLAKQTSENKFTATVIVTNIPSSATAADVKALFPDAVELRFTVAKGAENTSQATVTMPTPKDATLVKRKKLKIGDNQLQINFAINKKKQNKTNNEGGKPNQKFNKSGKKKNKAKINKQQKRKLPETSTEPNNEGPSPKKIKPQQQNTKQPKLGQLNKNKNPPPQLENQQSSNQENTKQQKKKNKNKPMNAANNPVANEIESSKPKPLQNNNDKKPMKKKNINNNMSEKKSFEKPIVLQNGIKKKNKNKLKKAEN